MPFLNLAERLAGEIGAALREPEFQKLFRDVPPDRRETVVAEQMARRNVDAGLISLTAAPAGMPGAYQIEWQPKAGGDPQAQWFTPDHG